MRVAVAGPGSLARYFAEEFPAADYSIHPALEGIKNSSTLISTILGYSPSFIDVNRRFIQAAKETATCKRFIPAEYGGNLKDFPDQPGFYARSQAIIRNELAGQDELEWTLLSTGWFADCIVPDRNRFLRGGDGIPIDHENDRMLIPGSGKEPLDITALRDVASAVAKLVQAPEWERYTYISGESTTWNNSAVLVKEKHPQMSTEYRSLNQLVEDVVAHPQGYQRIAAEMGIFCASRAASLPAGKVAAHRENYFSGIKFRKAKDLLTELERDPTVVV